MEILKKIPQVYLDKTLNGTDIKVTAAGIANAAKEFGDDAVVKLFSNGEIAADKNGRSILDALGGAAKK